MKIKYPNTQTPKDPNLAWVAGGFAILHILFSTLTPAANAAVGGGVFIPGGGVTLTLVTNIATAIAGQVGGATNGIPKLSGSGTNLTAYGLTTVSNSIVLVSGDTQTPYTTIPLALAAATAGDMVQVGPGDYTVPQLAIPDRVALIGSDWNARLIFTNTPVNIALGNSVRVENFNLTNTVGPAFIFSTNGSGPLTNIVIRNVLTSGGADTLYDQGEDIQVDVYDSVFENRTSDWAVDLRGDNTVVRFFNVTIIAASSAVALGDGTATLLLYECDITSADNAITTGTGTVELYGGKVRSTAQVALVHTGGTISVCGTDFDDSSTGTITFCDIYGDGSAVTALNATALASGTVPTARLGSGTASSSTYLRGDNTWATPAGGSGTSTNLLYPDGKIAVNTREDANDFQIIEMLDTNGIAFLLRTNVQDGDSGFHLQTSTGFQFLTSQETSGSQETYLRGIDSLGFSLGASPVALFNGSTYVFNDTSGSAAINFSSRLAPVFGDTTLRTDLISDGQLLVKAGTSIVGTSGIPSLTVAGDVDVQGTIYGDGSGISNVTASAFVPWHFTTQNPSGSWTATDATIRYWGQYNDSTAVQTNAVWKVPFDCTLTNLNVKVTVGGTLGTTEAVAHQAFVNGATIAIGVTNDWSLAGPRWFQAAGSHALTAGDVIVLRVITPTFATDPTQVRIDATFSGTVP